MILGFLSTYIWKPVNGRCFPCDVVAIEEVVCEAVLYPQPENVAVAVAETIEINIRMHTVSTELC